MKGKNQRSTIHKANGEAAARIAELEAEVERLRDVENVGLLHVKALGEIERLTGRLLELERYAGEVERLTGVVEDARKRIDELEEVAERRAKAIGNAVVWAMRNFGVGAPDTNFEFIQRTSDLFGLRPTGVSARKAALIRKGSRSGTTIFPSGKSTSDAIQMQPEAMSKMWIRYVDGGRPWADDEVDG